MRIFCMPFSVSLALHGLEARIVVWQLPEMRERYLPCHQEIVVGDIRLRVMCPVLELHCKSHAELFEVNRRPVDTDAIANALRFLLCKFLFHTPCVDYTALHENLHGRMPLRRSAL